MTLVNSKHRDCYYHDCYLCNLKIKERVRIFLSVVAYHTLLKQQQLLRQ